MKENFDCTQFITFDLFVNLDLDDLMKPFKDMGFDIISSENIKNVKKLYFKQFIRNQFIELRYDDFMGEFEDWENLEEPPSLIANFAEQIKRLSSIISIKNLKVILTFFAEEGKSSTETIKINADNLLSGLFTMSRHNFSVWTDNMVIEII